MQNERSAVFSGSSGLDPEPGSGIVGEACGFVALRDVDASGLQHVVEDLLRLPKDEFRQHLDGWATHWSRRFEFPFTYLAARRFWKAQWKPNDVRALESGSGATPLPLWLAHIGYHVTCIDLDPGLKEVWDSCGVAREGRVRFQAADMESLPFPDEHFDLVYSVSALEHTGNPDSAVRELIRVAKKGALVVVTMDIATRGAHGVDEARFLAIQEMLCHATTQFYPSRWSTPAALLTAAKRARNYDVGALRQLARKLLDHANAARTRDFAVWCYAGVRHA